MYRRVDTRGRRGWGTVRRVWRGITSALSAHPGVFVGVAATAFSLNLVLPLLVLSVARKPWDYFSVNPWLHNLPHWMLTGHEPLGQKLAFVSQAALVWFVASSPYDAPEWGFAVTTQDVLRWMVVAALFGAYFTVWVHHRRRCRVQGVAVRRAARGGVVGAVLTTLGFSTMPCSVAGCGAPVLPVVALALTGLSSVTLSWITTVSTVLAALVLVGVAAGLAFLGWAVGDTEDTPRPLVSVPGTS